MVRNWANGKSPKEIDDELWRILWTYDAKTLREMLFNSLSPDEKKTMVNDWHENDE